MSHTGAREHSAASLPHPGTTERLAALLADWRADSDALRRRGAAPFAELLDRCVGELEAALAGTGMPAGPALVIGQPAARDVLLTPEQVAERLATTPAWVYSHWRQALPFGQKLGHRTLRFSAAKLERHLARGGSAGVGGIA